MKYRSGCKCVEKSNRLARCASCRHRKRMKRIGKHRRHLARRAEQVRQAGIRFRQRRALENEAARIEEGPTQQQRRRAEYLREVGRTEPAPKMPIRKNLQHHYGPEWRAVTRPRILARAGNCCERCGKPNHESVATASGKNYHDNYWMVWTHAARFEDLNIEPVFFNETGEPSGLIRSDAAYRTIRVVLTVAHLNHVPGDDRDENLAALCQWCHLIHDLTHHRESRADRKDAARPLLA